ncbi:MULTISPECIES: Rho-binding antiterminator [Proteus]|uniref:Rho-binding antiterminator n=1 Tax=Proteus penneri TaxID=102862 RepID=A0ABS0W958_9GAMM|nr:MULTISPECIES: Rho-binding antiterminator [Proteus]EEG86596.1 modulator of Rho-dependent transcription termination (ROF) [Proteus penneri ATCC 35198]MBJ2118686.1 Rho-binding antiterminator [Proteus penneri]MCO8051335.1 Rho-binding antiterminator [Proteus penneri]NBL90006.1 Rho-binding antiterminator [Proteus sp. G2673]NBM02682.1 Rho-binding antiterminator [Proteus sp. G2671]
MSTNTEYQPINCDDYEYLELACQRGLALHIELHDGELIEGIADDLFLSKRVEYLKVKTSEGSKDLRLDVIASFSNPELGTIIIKSE